MIGNLCILCRQPIKDNESRVTWYPVWLPGKTPIYTVHRTCRDNEPGYQEFIKESGL